MCAPGEVWYRLPWRLDAVLRTDVLSVGSLADPEGHGCPSASQRTGSVKLSLR